MLKLIKKLQGTKVKSDQTLTVELTFAISWVQSGEIIELTEPGRRLNLKTEFYSKRQDQVYRRLEWEV
jgi:hypothetical protein